MSPTKTPTIKPCPGCGGVLRHRGQCENEPIEVHARTLKMLNAIASGFAERDRQRLIIERCMAELKGYGKVFERRATILGLLKEGYATIKEIADDSKIPYTTVRKILNQLTKEKVVNKGRVKTQYSRGTLQIRFEIAEKTP